MFIAHKNNVIQNVDETEWSCRMVAKSFNDNSDYWSWIETITTQDADGFDVITYPSEDFTIVECTDEDVHTRLGQLGGYVSRDMVYNIKWSDDKGNAEEIKDHDENSHDPKQYVQSHLKGDDTAKTARLLAEQWTRIRSERDRLLTESDWTQGNDTPLSDADKAKWTTYRGKLRTLPVDQSSKTTYADITWPTQP